MLNYACLLDLIQITVHTMISIVLAYQLLVCNSKRLCKHSSHLADIEPAANTSNGTAPAEASNIAAQLSASAAEPGKTDWTQETLSVVVVGASGKQLCLLETVWNANHCADLH